jgi:hypothetical protein
VFGLIKRIFSSKELTRKEKYSVGVPVEELRLYSRYSLIFPNVGQLKILDNGQVGTIVNLSYGGMLVKFEDPWVEEIGPHDNRSFNAELEVLGQRTPTNIQYVHTLDPDNGLSGFSFQHRNVETLVFLREIVENFRIGSSLRQLPNDMIKDEYKSNGWKCFRGEGPTDIFQQGSSSNPTKAIKLSYREGSSYCELNFKDDKFQSGRSISIDGSYGSVDTHSEGGLDQAIFEHAIQILIGAASNEQTSHFAKPMLEKALAHKK